MGGPREGAYDHLTDDLVELEVDGILLVEGVEFPTTIRTWLYRIQQKGLVKGIFRTLMYGAKCYIIKVSEGSNGT